MRHPHGVIVVPLGSQTTELPSAFSDKKDKALWQSSKRGTRGSCGLLPGSAQMTSRGPVDLWKGLQARSGLTPLNGQDHRAGEGPGHMEKPRPYRSRAAPLQVLLLR